MSFPGELPGAARTVTQQPQELNESVIACIPQTSPDEPAEPVAEILPYLLDSATSFEGFDLSLIDRLLHPNEFAAPEFFNPTWPPEITHGIASVPDLDTTPIAFVGSSPQEMMG